ncbi:MAG: glycosyltransferase family 4 protein, partial [Steroidobacteraceae bacterium]
PLILQTPRSTAFLSSGRDSYGVRRSLESLFRAVAAKQVEPTIICLQEGEMMEFARRTGVRTLLCPIGTPDNFGSLGSALRNFRFMLEASRTLAAVIRDSGVDSVIVRQPYQMPLAARATSLAGVRGYWLMPNLISNRYPLRVNALMYDFLLARYGMTAIANGAYTRGTLAGFARSAVAHLGIDPAEFDTRTPPAARERYGFAPSDAVFGVFARLVSSKGQLVLVRAMARVIRDFPDLRLLLCGGPLDSDYAAALRSEVHTLGLDGKVVLSGPSDRLADSLPSLYAMCDVIVNASLGAEPFGLSVIEGMLVGKPLLVHALGGPAETVRNGIDGWHITDPSVAGFERGVRDALRDRSSWTDIGARAAEHARAHFTHLHAAERIIAVMRGHTQR